MRKTLPGDGFHASLLKAGGQKAPLSEQTSFGNLAGNDRENRHNLTLLETIEHIRECHARL